MCKRRKAHANVTFTYFLNQDIQNLKSPLKIQNSMFMAFKETMFPNIEQR